MKQIFTALSIIIIASISLSAQTGTIRGNLYDEETGDPIIYGTVRLGNTGLGTNTDFEGFFNINKIPEGDYKLIATYVGYDSVSMDVKVREGAIIYKQLYITESAIQLGVVDISGKREQARSDIQISKITVTPKQIRSLPSTGGESDIAQYLPVLPGIIVSGDQGGQMYIRGGSPIQNKILLDGMTIYNPFHSIGFFSVFETETIRSVDVLTGGFNAEHGGRVSAVVDIKTREGNKKRYSGLVSASPFQAKALVEGPIKKLSESGGSSSSFLLTGKHSYLDQTSKTLYEYANSSIYSNLPADSLGNPSNTGLPYKYTDLYGKLSFLTGNGTKLNLFGFNFSDRVKFANVTDLQWDAYGAGAQFTLIPPNSNIILDGTLAFSDYKIGLEEADGAPRSSGITAFNAQVNFNYFGNKNQINYGFEFNGFNTDLVFRNYLGFTFQQKDFTTEISGFFKFKQELGDLILEPGLRVQFYPSQSDKSIEPRLGLKYNLSDKFRFKLAGGLYSQNLISTVNERDVVNLFVGFLAGPEEKFFKPGTSEVTDHRLQKSIHGIAGFELDITNNLLFNVEGYYKKFTQLIQINRNKLSELDSDFAAETGDAYGVDFSLKYEGAKTYLWMTYSLGHVTRDDGVQEYPTVFDRRHNVNILGTYAFGHNNAWEASARWNMGSGFPFSLTQGFYSYFNFQDGLSTDVLQENPDLGIVYADERNSGRLPYYHRLDVSLKRTFEFSKHSKLEAVVSVTNVYDRENIFFFDRVRYDRVNQLPILPSAGLTFSF